MEKAGETPVFFIGDSFSPSGIDDYCLMNRNLMREDSGYFRCFEVVDSLPGGTWLVNQHIPHRFRFNAAETTFLLTRYRERAAMVAQFAAWDDPNYAIDEQWAGFFPYGSETAPGESFGVALRVWNHSTVERTFELRPDGPFAVEPATATLTLPPRGRGEAAFTLAVPADAKAGVHVITADVTRGDGLVLTDWCEALVKVALPAGRKP